MVPRRDSREPSSGLEAGVTAAGDASCPGDLGALKDTCEGGVGVPVDGGDSKTRLRWKEP